ncbi:MAG: bifunctional enoyl-CoA hydratase/phosphate acetyltransferase [Gammaproteobacteria bacterium]
MTFIKSLNGMIEAAASRPPVRAAIVHPTRAVVMHSLQKALAQHLIEPVLVGPEHRIRAAAEEAQLDISAFRLVPTEHSHAAAEAAVQLARDGEVAALIKGDLATGEVMEPVVGRQNGIRTERRLSHVFVLEVATYPKLLLITDAAINIQPTLDDKRDITQNAIDLAHALGIDEPRVAIMSAIEKVNSRLQSTVDAAALCKMADRGQITGGILDGPLAFDNAISAEAAHEKGIRSAVSGHTDIMVVPDLESGNLVAKQLRYLADARTAGIVLGARVPIALNSRSEDAFARYASMALVSLYVSWQQANTRNR